MKIILCNRNSEPIQIQLEANTWYRVGITWSSGTGQVKVYTNGNLLLQSNGRPSSEGEIVQLNVDVGLKTCKIILTLLIFLFIYNRYFSFFLICEAFVNAI